MSGRKIEKLELPVIDTHPSLLSRNSYRRESRGRQLPAKLSQFSNTYPPGGWFTIGGIDGETRLAQSYVRKLESDSREYDRKSRPGLGFKRRNQRINSRGPDPARFIYSFICLFIYLCWPVVPKLELRAARSCGYAAAAQSKIHFRDESGMSARYPVGRASPSSSIPWIHGAPLRGNDEISPFPLFSLSHFEYGSHRRLGFWIFYFVSSSITHVGYLLSW